MKKKSTTTVVYWIVFPLCIIALALSLLLSKKPESKDMTENQQKKHSDKVDPRQDTPLELPIVPEEEIDYDELVANEFDDGITYEVVEVKPLFQGKNANSFSKWVTSHIVYPDIAQQNGIQGRVVLSFRIEEDGSINDVKVIRSIDPALDKEAVRVISSSPKWTPGEHHGEKVSVLYTMPVNYTLE